MPGWLAVWTRSRHERHVCEQLRSLQIPTFLPTRSRVSHWKDRSKRIDWPLFPGYCFAHGDVDAAHLILRCHGVAAVLTEGGRHAMVPEAEIEAIRRLVCTRLPYEACTSVPGTPVRVLRGPLAGVQGRLIRGSHDAQLLLSVELLNCAARVWVSELDVEALPVERGTRAPALVRCAVA